MVEIKEKESRGVVKSCAHKLPEMTEFAPAKIKRAVKVIRVKQREGPVSATGADSGAHDGHVPKERLQKGGGRGSPARGTK